MCGRLNSRIQIIWYFTSNVPPSHVSSKVGPPKECGTIPELNSGYTMNKSNNIKGGYFVYKNKTLSFNGSPYNGFKDINVLNLTVGDTLVMSPHPTGHTLYPLRVKSVKVEDGKVVVDVDTEYIIKQNDGLLWWFFKTTTIVPGVDIQCPTQSWDPRQA